MFQQAAIDAQANSSQRRPVIVMSRATRNIITIKHEYHRQIAVKLHDSLVQIAVFVDAQPGRNNEQHQRGTIPLASIKETSLSGQQHPRAAI